MNNGKMLALNDLSVWWTPGKSVLEKLSMELGANEVIGLIGMWSVSIWVLLCIVIAEVLSLSLVVRRI